MRDAVIFGASGGIGQALATALIERGWRVAGGARNTAELHPNLAHSFAFDLLDEASIARAAEQIAERPPELVIVATGVLTLPNGAGPERSFRALDAEAMVSAYRLNAVGPALIAKHVLPILPRDRRNVFAVLGARVGSIGDNRLGGWHSYRMSKAALAMLVRNLAIEMRRTHPETVIAGLHPGTVDTELSAPFQSSLAPGQLVAPVDAARNLLAVCASLTSGDSGGVFDWKAERVPA